LTSIRSANPEVIFVPGYYGQVGVIAKQAKELGIKAPLLGGDGWDAPQLFQLGGEALNGSYMANHYSVDDPSPATQKFVNDYKARYNGTAPDAIGALGYDAMKVLADAIQRAGTTNGTKLRDAIAQTKGFQGVTGSININNERNAVKPAVVFELQNGKYVYKETIQPEGVAPTTATTGTSPAPATTTTTGTTGMTTATPAAGSSPATSSTTTTTTNTNTATKKTP
jgi:branched-chain amino acid transport system substrate-binding protein